MAADRTFRWQGITLATLFVGYAGYYVCRSNLSVATPLLLDAFGDQGLTKEDIGLVASLGTLFYCIGKITNGLLTDFLGGRALFLVGMIASVCCTVAFGLASGLIAFLGLWAANRYVQSMGWGALVKVASRWYPVQVQATIMGVLAMSYLFGDGIGRFYLGSLIQLGVGWRGVFLLAAGTLGLIAAVSLFTLKGSPEAVGGWEPPAHPENLFGAAGDSPQPPGLVELLVPLLTSVTFWLVCLMSFGLTLIRETFNFWIPTYLNEVTHLEPGSAAKASMVFPTVGAVGALLGGRLSDRLKGKDSRVAVPSLVLLVGALWLLAAVDTEGRPLLALVLLSAVGFFLMAPYSFCSGVIPLHLGGKRGSSTAAGLFDSAGYLGGILSGYGVASVVKQHSWQYAFMLLAGLAALTALTALLYWVKQEFNPGPRRADPLPQEPPVATDLPPGPDVIRTILHLFESRGDAAYIGEPVSQTEHALQTAWAAEKAGAGPALVSAALLHDIGHLLHHLPESCAQDGIDDHHENLAARWLAKYFGPEVTEPIRLHVAAKRYLCAAEPGYRESLSEASELSLKLQGGPFAPEELRQFAENPHAQAAVALRRWDEEAKVKGLATPDLGHFRPALEAARAACS